MDAKKIAKYVLLRAMLNERMMPNRELQHFMFLLQKWSIKKRGVSLYKNDIEAWLFAPVTVDVYFHYSSYGGLPILPTSVITDSVELDCKIIREELEYYRGKEYVEDMDKELDRLLEMDYFEIDNESRNEGGAWDKVYNGSFGNKVITTDHIEQFP